MIKAEHTPGPWDKIIKMDGFTAVGGKTLIARVFSTAFRDTKNEAANATLVAAAPDMLAALEASEREYADMEDGAPVDAGCIECTCGTVPNTLNTGLCAHHLRVKAIAKARSAA